MQHFMSMRSELSDAKESIQSNTFIGGRLFPKNDIPPSDSADELVVKGVESNTNIGKLNGMGYQLKVINEEDNNSNALINSERSLKTFHKDFVNRQGARNISLA